MSGHSKWSTIRRQKGANDAARGKLFSKLARGISIAVKTGGSNNPDQNYSLRIAIEAARAENMPKDTIERAINKASEAGQLEEVTYEGYAQDGIQVMIEAATDNRNRTAQIMKSALDRAGGSLGGPGSVAFNFEKKGVITLSKDSDYETQQLTLIDLGAEDIEEENGEVYVYVNSNELFQFKEKLSNAGFNIISAELIQRPKTYISVDEKKMANLYKLLEALDEEEDVQKIFTNAQMNE